MVYYITMVVIMNQYQYEYNSEGLYICTICGAQFEPGHSVVCKDESNFNKLSLRKSDINAGVDLETGMKLIHASDYEEDEEENDTQRI